MKFFSLIFQGDVHAGDNEKIIAKENYLQLVSAKQIVDKAEEDAEDLRKNTEKECEQLRKQNKEEGFQEGLTQFNEKLLAFDTIVKLMQQELQKQILPLALKAAKKIVAKELQLFPETIVDIVMQSLLPVTQSHRIIIYINKADKEILEKEKPKLRELFEKLDSFVILERADVEVGGCIIETETGIINAELENQWRALETAFERYTKQKGG